MILTPQNNGTNYANNATQMGIVAQTVKGGSDYAHDLRCGYALALHNGAPDAAAATDDAVDFANGRGRSAFERTAVI